VSTRNPVFVVSESGREEMLRRIEAHILARRVSTPTLLFTDEHAGDSKVLPSGEKLSDALDAVARAIETWKAGGGVGVVVIHSLGDMLHERPEMLTRQELLCHPPHYDEPPPAAEPETPKQRRAREREELRGFLRKRDRRVW
jgi:hypothetical protein